MRGEAGRAALKTTTRALIRDLGGFEAAAAACNRSTARLHGYADPTTDRFIPVDVLLDLESCAASPVVTACLAQQLGHQLVRQQPAAGVSPLRALAALLHGSGMATADAADALADGHINPAEAARLLPVLGRLAVLASAAVTALSHVQPEE